MFDDTRGEVGHQRQELVSNPSAKKARVGVAGVLRIRNVVTLDMGHDVGSASSNEGTDEIPRSGWEHGQARGAGAPEKAKERGFGAIVGMVPGGEVPPRPATDGLGSRRFERRTKGLVPGFASPCHQVATGFERHPRDAEGYSQLLCEPGGKLELTGGLRGGARD